MSLDFCQVLFLVYNVNEYQLGLSFVLFIFFLVEPRRLFGNGKDEKPQTEKIKELSPVS
jgi:hypothetical protein